MEYKCLLSFFGIAVNYFDSMNETIETTETIDVRAIAQRLQDSGVLNCNLYRTEDLENATRLWIPKLIEAISEDPDWFLLHFETEHFVNALPELVNFTEDEADAA